MRAVNLVIAVAQMPCKGFRYGDRPVLAARASYANNEIMLALLKVVREQKIHHIAQALEKLIALRMFKNKVFHRRVKPGFTPELGDIKRIRHKADVKNQVGVDRQPVLVSE